ncbi:MAG TPA: lmo0937 family membrane protein [Terriglobales bacterium]|jgi:hypothetical protein|nr:lmo0937 family membrane protein [Terriglobales bacterium]
MLWFVLLLIILLWTVGTIANYTFGGLLHILLLVALVLLILQLASGRGHTT